MNEPKEEMLSSHAFHQWKQDDCTKSLIKLVDYTIELAEKSIIEYVKGSSDLSTNRLSFYKGQLQNCYELQEVFENKENLEKFMEVEDAEME